MRNLIIEKEIIDSFFLKSRKKRAYYLIEKDSTTNMLFGKLQESYINPLMMKQIQENYLSETYIINKISKSTNNINPYFFSYELKCEMNWNTINQLDFLSFQEVIIYFGKGVGYFQAHEKGGSRERYYLHNTIY